MSDKKSTLLELDVHRRKLVRLVGEMLKKADEIDQSSKQSTRMLDANWHDRLAVTCRDLSALSQAAAGIEALIKDSNAAKAQESLLRSVRIANHLSQALNELKHQAGQ